MPPRRSLKHPLGMGDPFESLEDRIKRLRPDEGAMPPVVAPTPIPPKAKTAASGSRAPPAFVFTRSDAPVIRHARRGSVAVAADALQQLGVSSLIGDLMEDRMAKTTTGPNASLLKTWTLFNPFSSYGFRGRHRGDASATDDASQRGVDRIHT